MNKILDDNIPIFKILNDYDLYNDSDNDLDNDSAIIIDKSLEQQIKLNKQSLKALYNKSFDLEIGKMIEYNKRYLHMLYELRAKLECKIDVYIELISQLSLLFCSISSQNVLHANRMMFENIIQRTQTELGIYLFDIKLDTTEIYVFPDYTEKPDVKELVKILIKIIASYWVSDNTIVNIPPTTQIMEWIQQLICVDFFIKI